MVLNIWNLWVLHFIELYNCNYFYDFPLTKCPISLLVHWMGLCSHGKSSPTSCCASTKWMTQLCMSFPIFPWLSSSWFCPVSLIMICVSCYEIDRRTSILSRSVKAVQIYIIIKVIYIIIKQCNGCDHTFILQRYWYIFAKTFYNCSDSQLDMLLLKVMPYPLAYLYGLFI